MNLQNFNMYDNLEKKENENNNNIIEGYNKILWYQKNYEKDLNNWIIDLNGERIDSNWILQEKLVNIEIFSFNAINNLFWLGLEKIGNKKVLNKGVDLWTSTNTIDSYGPEWNLQIKKWKERVEKQQAEVQRIYNNFKNKNITKKEALEKIRKTME